MQVYVVEWECLSCGFKHSFRRGVTDEDGWPNKFELVCDNPECSQEQDVPLQACTVTPLRVT